MKIYDKENRRFKSHTGMDWIATALDSNLQEVLQAQIDIGLEYLGQIHKGLEPWDREKPRCALTNAAFPCPAGSRTQP